ncbi:MAG: putative glycoside hydrolase, partial [Chloroflexota bacterium]
MRSFSKKSVALIGGALLVMFAVGLSLAWVQDTQYSKMLFGQVSDERNQQPIAGASVRVYKAGESPRETQTDESGHYRMGIGTTALTVSVQARGFQTTFGPFQANDLLIKEFPLDVVLRPYVVTGIVKDSATQKPIVYAALSAGDASAQSGDDGRFTLERIEPGAKLKVEASGYYPHESVWTGDHTVDVALTVRTLAIAVSNVRDGKPLKATVILNGTKYQTDAQGRVVVREPAAGTKISASAEDFATSEAAYTGQAIVELPLKPSAFKAVVKDAKTGKAIAGATVFVNGVAALSTSDEGKFGLPDATPGVALKIKAAGYRLFDTVVPTAPTMEIALTPFAVRGVYLPFGLLTNESKVRGLLNLVDSTELNALVVDVKSDRGRLAFHSDNPIIKSIGAEEVRMDLKELLRIAHEKKIYVIARVVTFKDEPLAKAHPNWAVQSKAGLIWYDGEKLPWANPYLREVWNYNVAIAKEIAALGFDEIQFDYIRFPSDGNVSAIYFPPPHTAETRATALREFLNEVNLALKPYPIFISADIFGMTVWTHDDMGIGQRLEEIAQRVDYVQPMVYPSTFSADNLGYKNPPAHPYDVIYRSVQSAMRRVTTPVRPWLQAYSIGNAPYGLKEYLLQKQAANDAGSAG